MFYVLNLIAALHARVDDAKDRGATATEYAMLVAFIADRDHRRRRRSSATSSAPGSATSATRSA